MKLDKGIVRAAQRLIRKSPKVVQESQVVREIVEELEIDDIRNNKIYFTSDNLARIEKYFDTALGKPLLTLNLDIDSRFNASKEFVNEKWAKGGVFEAMLCMASTRKIPVIGDDVYTSPGTVFSMRYEKLDISKISKLLLIENGELITNWDRVISHLPIDYRDATLLFKGYGENQKYLEMMLKSIDSDVNVAVFFDYDAAGIDMALKLSEYRPIDLVIPLELTQEVLDKSKLDEFDEQFPQLIRRLDCPNTPLEIKAILNSLKDMKIAITQEHLITHNALLGVIKNVRVNND